MSDLGGYTKPIAQKKHRCIWCGDAIPKGEKHQHCKGKWEGDWQDWRMHAECFAAFQKVTGNEGGFIDPYVNERPSSKQQKAQEGK